MSTFRSPTAPHLPPVVPIPPTLSILHEMIIPLFLQSENALFSSLCPCKQDRGKGADLVKLLGFSLQRAGMAQW